MKKNIFLILLFITFSSFAQGEANIWIFGNKAGLDFNSGSPVAITDGQMNTAEGCGTISNAAGQLLFYTDGIRVWNKNHQIMPNGKGLKGSSSGSQAALIVPKPESTNIYYIFTATALADPDGIQYSEVDLNLDGGLGNITAKKNIPLLTPACEKITVVKKNGTNNYWLVIHEYGNNNFLAYEISSSGLNLTPVISSIGATISNNINQTVGYLKFSPDGTKLISCNYQSIIELFDFDSATGKITNPRLVSNKVANYGAEFSPSGNIAYITTGDRDIFELLQFDLTAANIQATATQLYLANNIDHQVGALQLAVDRKIYTPIFDSHYISVINKPELLGTACDFQLDAIPLGTGLGQAGLPQFIQSYFVVGIDIENNCLGEATTFSLSGNQNITSADWDFGDGTTSIDINPTHTYLTEGNFTVSVTATGTNGTSTKTKEIVISKVPLATQPNNMSVCDSDNDGLYTFDLTTQDLSILNGQDPNLYKVKYFANNTLIASPTSYQNKIPYQEENIKAEVFNISNVSCNVYTSFIIDVNDSPSPSLSTQIPDLALCDNRSVGTDNDGRITFDLTQRATAILNGQLSSQFLISYYKDGGFTQLIPTPALYENTIPTETIFVKITNKDNPNCTANTSFRIKVLDMPVIPVTVDLKQCDDNSDGFSVFNLDEAISKITTNAINEKIAFFKTIIDAQNNTNPILNTSNYINTTVSNDMLYVRVSNINNCFKITKLNLLVSTTQIPHSFSKLFTQCDDEISGSNTDGIAIFNFSNVTNEVLSLFPSGQLLDITYYKNLEDALTEKNNITNISNYSNFGYPNSQKIYIRVDSRINNDCLGLGGYITLNVESIPIVKSVRKNHCDDNHDGFFAFDTSTIESRMLNGLTNVQVTYIDQNNNPLASPLPNPFVTNSQTIRVNVKNNSSTSCSYDTVIEFIVDDLPEAFPISKTMTTACDNESDPLLQDGKYPFDTTSFQNIILGSQTGMMVRYYDANSNPLPSPLPNPFLTVTQQIKAEVINTINPSCSASILIPFTVNPVPDILLTGTELVCSDLPTFTKTINAGLTDESQKANFKYSWALNDALITDENQYYLTINKEGIYKVTATNDQGCSRIRVITVNASDKAKVTVDIIDLSSENRITVLTTGTGDYVFSLDDEFGQYQTGNVFNNVPSGIHTVYVKDLNGCGIVANEAAVLGIPNYFTPNQDGFNDTWNIKGINSISNSKTIIQIFDRYGKLLKEMNAAGNGWDGTYAGHQLPASDYWYNIQLEDGRSFKGHFSLKR
ncbi:T9SS type B sorting domain-containing protein [Flavobacterium limi]|uniref:PKD domain-containing protein n=1 Tax=Flavobacterium limi TaxID=2045105 RepID=A0ABQ1U8D8_9FLAO|nr:T9SS type B sorting domain-containing protein [Flavobacterium limi]GGF10391.1 hypothetical protein GCM10011518_19480 [Flavobacterium limi]